MLKFKTLKLETEFQCNIHSKLRALIYAVSGFVGYKFNKNIVVTHLVRTQAEQDKIYGNHRNPAVSSKYKQAPWMSRHQFIPCEASDLRIIGFTHEELNAILGFLNHNGYAILERDHLHCQLT